MATGTLALYESNPKIGVCIACSAIITKSAPFKNGDRFEKCGGCEAKFRARVSAAEAPKNPKTGKPYAAGSKAATEFREGHAWLLRAQARGKLARHHAAVYGFEPEYPLGFEDAPLHVA